MNDVPETIVRCPSCGVPMDVSALAPFTNVVCPKCAETTRVKRDFGPYELMRRHAVGGMSMVFAARDKTLDREVALKILSEDFSADERRIAAFEEEARLTASFSHPNVVRVFTTGRSFGRFYIAMELVPGDHFEHLIRERGKIPELEVLPLAIEVAQGLKAAHAAGLIHRDVKPGNILLDAEGHAKLVDFGLALVTQGGKARATEAWATPYYVPPETVEGDSEDFRSDIYAFGATLYHALSGKPPCGEESMSTDVLREAKKKILPLGTADKSISSATCRIVDRAMAYDPAGRFNSYEELIAALKAALVQLESGHGEPPAEHDSARRHRKWIMAAGAAPIAAAVIFVWLAKRPEPTVIANKPSPAPPPPPVMEADHSAEIARGYRAARAAVEAGDFATAERELAALHGNPQVQEPTRSWAGAEALLAAFLDGRPADALGRAHGLREHLRTLPESHPLAGPEWAGLLDGMGELRPLAAVKVNSPAAALVAAMLAGLKNWDQGMLEQAAACFNTAASIHLPGDEAWAAIYQNMATAYLHDHRLLSGQLFTVEPADAAACEAAVSLLDETLATLKTRGRGRFNVRAWQLDLKRRAVLLASAAPAPEPAPAAEPEAAAVPNPSPQEVLERLSEFATERRFAEASAWLKKLPQAPQGVSREALLNMTEAAAVFLTDIGRDLAREPFTGELPLEDGGNALRVSVSRDGVITAVLASGGVRTCEWRDFPADSLIAMHRVLVVRNPSGEIERLRRHECAIAFDWLAGNRERALTAAAKLSQGNPLFKKRWDSISAGLPE